MVVPEHQRELDDVTNEYRKHGSALALSLAAVSGSEAWWFYSFLPGSLEGWSSLRWLLWVGTVGTAIGVFVSSFVVQATQYKGTFNKAQAVRIVVTWWDSLAAQGKEERGPTKSILRAFLREHRASEASWFDWGDRTINLMLWLALVNFVLALSYIVTFRPSTRFA